MKGFTDYIPQFEALETGIKDGNVKHIWYANLYMVFRNKTFLGFFLCLFLIIINTSYCLAKEEGNKNKYWKDVLSVARYDTNKLELFRKGGNTFYMRHSPKPNLRSDGLIRMSMIKPHLIKRPVIASSACLSEIGREEALMIGMIFKDLRIPIHEVYSSDMCRSFETAELAFEREPEILDFVNYKVPMGKGPEYKEKFVKFFFEKSPGLKKNRVIVGHGGGKLKQLGFGDEFSLDESGILVFNHSSNSLIFSGKSLEQWALWYYKAEFE